MGNKFTVIYADSWMVDAARTRDHKETAERLGITEEELWRRKHQLKAAWEAGGGADGARARLHFAEGFLAKHKAANVKV